jgi:hypothetical protein
MSLQFCGDVMVELTNMLGSVDSPLLVTESQSFGKFPLSPSSGESKKISLDLCIKLQAVVTSKQKLSFSLEKTRSYSFGPGTLFDRIYWIELCNFPSSSHDANKLSLRNIALLQLKQDDGRTGRNRLLFGKIPIRQLLKLSPHFMTVESFIIFMS